MKREEEEEKDEIGGEVERKRWRKKRKKKRRGRRNRRRRSRKKKMEEEEEEEEEEEDTAATDQPQEKALSTFRRKNRWKTSKHKKECDMLEKTADRNISHNWVSITQHPVSQRNPEQSPAEHTTQPTVTFLWNTVGWKLEFVCEETLRKRGVRWEPLTQTLWSLFA